MKAPFPYFGGKAAVAEIVWDALGDCGHYIEPFCGSCAVLLARTNYDPQRHTETVNDADGHICNVWRGLQYNPDEVAKWCDWPVNHADLMSRKKVLYEKTGVLLEKLCTDDNFFDAKLAGYYIWAASCWIGSGLVRPTSIPRLGDTGNGVHAKGKRPHLADTGKGVHAKGKRPNLGCAGNGVHAKGQIPHLADTGKGKGVQEPYNTPIYDWFRQLSERLRNVRVVCGDWARVCGGNWQNSHWRSVGIFFDPPYSDKAGRRKDVYATDSESVAHEVREWCLERGKQRDYRIVLAGYYDEHQELLNHGWSAHGWSAGGGYANTSGDAEKNPNRHKETLFMSPHCLKNGLF